MSQHMNIPKHEVERIINVLRYGTHPHPSPHADYLAQLIEESAPAQDERGINPEHTLFNEIRGSMPVNEDGEETRYIINEQQLQRIRALEFNRPAQTEQQPVRMVRTKGSHMWEQIDAESFEFCQQDSDCECRELYAAPIAQTAPQPEKSGRRQWPSSRDAGRFGDMSTTAHMRVGLDNDNDVYVSVYDDEGGASVEYCVPGSGGGKSPRTREALIALMVAIEQDNSDEPSRDWWARGAALSATPSPMENSHD